MKKPYLILALPLVAILFVCFLVQAIFNGIAHDLRLLVKHLKG
jgi:hypothetical protein